MRKHISSLVSFTTLFLVVLIGGGCSPQAKKARHLKQADNYYASDQYAKAEIEYLNALQIEPVNPEAISRLGVIYASQGRLSQAIPYLLKGKQLQPNNLEVRLKLAMAFGSRGNSKRAEEEATFVLEHNPSDPEAPLLFVESITNSTEVPAARQRLKNLPTAIAESAPVLAALGMLDLRERHVEEAEKLFRHALLKDPKSSAAMAAMGSWYVAQNNPSQANVAFKQASEWAHARSPLQLLYARYKMQNKEFGEAQQSLQEITRKTSDYLPALFIQAELFANQKKYSESSAFISKVLALDPLNPEALLLNARVELAMGEKQKAAISMEKMLKAYPKSPQTHFQLGLFHYGNNEVDAAITSFNQAISLAPAYNEAIMMLAEINLKKGETQRAINALKPLAEQRPDLVPARLMLAEAYRAQGNLNEALEIYHGLQELFPTNAQARYGQAMILLQQDKRDEARQLFIKTSELAPNYLPALEQLIAFDLAEKNYPAASQRIDAQIARDPKIAGLYLLRSKVLFTQGKASEGETALLKAIGLEPDSPQAYLLLARYYVNSKQEKKALANFQTTTLKNPKNIEALMMTAALQNQQNNFAAAREAYEKVLAINPRFVSALNDLAYLYGEHLNQPDKAQELAQKAVELSPYEPHIADTLGWILFKKRQFSWALTQIAKGATKLPDSAEIQFHLGMTYYMLGESAPARSAFKRTLELENNFPEKELIQNRLAILEIRPEATSSGLLEKLKQSLKDSPDDPIALNNLAAIYAHNGSLDLAIATYQASLKTSPENLNAMLALAQVYGEKGQNEKATDLVKTARKVAPDNPAVSRLLGHLAEKNGDYLWAVSLLRETLRKTPDDPEVNYELSQALYGVGRTAEATTLAQRSLQNTDFKHSEEARQFLSMVALETNPSAAASPQVERILEKTPDYIPALMARAAIGEQQSDASTVTAAYEKILAKFPNFISAKKNLVLWSAANPVNDQKASKLAASAREALPNDPELAKAFGIIVYRLGDFAKAAGLLRESTSQRKDDAEAMYYLGSAQSKLKQKAEGRESLRRALELKLRPELATEAQKILNEP